MPTPQMKVRQGNLADLQARNGEFGYARLTSAHIGNTPPFTGDGTTTLFTFHS